MLWALLASFILRLAFGLAIAMAWTPSRVVTSGFFRVHLWVLLGLNTFAALAVATSDLQIASLRNLCLAAAAVSYVGSVVWIYERRLLGQLSIYLVAFLDLTAALLLAADSGPVASSMQSRANAITSGLLLGLTTAAMLLGHWYLNTPTMQLRPLRQLLVALFVIVGVRTTLCGIGLLSEVSQQGWVSVGWCGLVTLRWLSGLVGVAGLAWMTWLTLRIPNTQSATGILYVAVLFCYLGELSSQLLNATATVPL